MKGESGTPKTMVRNSIKYGGVRLFNCMPEHIKCWEGSKEGFKKILDEFLGVIPDQPEVDNLIPDARTIDGKPSNSVVDWTRGTDYLAVLTDSKEADRIT